MQWYSSSTKPLLAGVYRVQVPVPDPGEDLDDAAELYAHWTGEYWTCWATTPRRALMCQWRGPTAGYLWALL